MPHVIFNWRCFKTTVPMHGCLTLLNVCWLGSSLLVSLPSPLSLHLRRERLRCEERWRGKELRMYREVGGGEWLDIVWVWTDCACTFVVPVGAEEDVLNLTGPCGSRNPSGVSLLPTIVQMPVLVCSPSHVFSTHQDSLDPPSRTRISKMWPFACHSSGFDRVEPTAIAVYLAEMLLMPLVWRDSSAWLSTVENIHMKHVICPVLVTTISPVMRASAAQTDGFFRWDDVLLAPDHRRPTLRLLISRHLPFPLLFTLLSHLLLPLTFLRYPRTEHSLKAAQVEVLNEKKNHLICPN